jgi:large repetitive protein
LSQSIANGADFIKTGILRRVAFALLTLVGCGRLAFDDRSPSTSDSAIADAVSAVSYPAAVAADTPVAYWRLNDTGAVAIDQMGAHNGGYSGAISKSQAGATSDGDKAVRFNDLATTTNMSVPDAPALRLSGSKSLELWFHPNGNMGQGTWPNLISKGAFTGGYLLYYYPPSANINYRENSATEVSITAAPIDTVGWNHIVFVYDATNMSNTIYVNGEAFSAGTFDWGANTNTSPFAVGTIRSTDQGTTGAVDEVAIYNAPLSAAQVAAHYAAARD